MSYRIVQIPVQHSSITYTAIKCHECGTVSHNLDDLTNRRCSYCKSTHSKKPTKSKSNKVRPDAIYQLYWGSGRKSTKAHWSINGSRSLCTQLVSVRAVGDVGPGSICVNCDDLKRRGFIR
jgi:hypothetical protein